MTGQIDAHQHFWHPGRGDYTWMPKDNPVLKRVYGPTDLLAQLAATAVDGTVRWVDFEQPGDLATLRRLAGHPKFKGTRPMIQDIPDDGWMLRDDVQWGFRALADLGLSLDALGFPQHLANFLILLKRYPDLRVVVDHCMKPQIRDPDPAAFAHWADGISRIADQTGAYVKFSALITEDRPDWSVARLKPYANHILKAFGAERVMWGSDWPVCRLRAEYADWHTAAQTLTADQSAAAKARIFGGAAEDFYRL